MAARQRTDGSCLDHPKTEYPAALAQSMTAEVQQYQVEEVAWC